jgi:GTP-binding protein
VKILKAELVTSASTGGPREGALRDDLAHFAFAGRSNVGKSSLLNALLGQKLARTSAAAGKTRQANIYRITAEGGQGGPGTWSTYLVDLPGYGYARGGDDSAQELAQVVAAYFAAGQQRQGHRGASVSGDGKFRGTIFLLVDSRHPGLASDIQAHRWLSDTAVAPFIVATKIDKLSAAERARNLREIERVFGQTPLAVSAAKGEGLDQLRRMIAGLARG